ncbi:unnamed protein product [Mytilus coruscus]|uniref:Myogenesis-regulating glycosidase n=1 Tax=Mytilus coruscus TaxID=42192 RepID=A0A6J8CG63_MYTCO|nr:unnamed protein product [Mytilus coruscus]
MDTETSDNIDSGHETENTECNTDEGFDNVDKRFHNVDSHSLSSRIDPTNDAFEQDDELKSDTNKEQVVNTDNNDNRRDFIQEEDKVNNNEDKADSVGNNEPDNQLTPCNHSTHFNENSDRTDFISNHIDEHLESPEDTVNFTGDEPKESDNKLSKVGSENHSRKSSDDSLETDEEEILQNTKFVDSDVPRRPSRSRRSGVVNDTNFIERLLSTSSTEDVCNDDILDSIQKEADINQNVNDEDSSKQANFFIGTPSPTKTNVDLLEKETPSHDNEAPSSTLKVSPDIYYEEGPKRLKRHAIEKEDFSGAKTFQDKNKLIVKYPNRKVSFEHRLLHVSDPHDKTISPLTIDVGSASPKPILKTPSRRSSFESHMVRHIQPTGHINYGYLHDEFKDKLEKRKVSLETRHFYKQESELYDDNEYENFTDGNSKPGIETGQFVKREKENGVSFQNGTCERSNSDEDFANGEISFSKRPSLIFDDDCDIINKNFSAHLRKDSIALTSEKLHQLESIHRHYNSCNYDMKESNWKKALSNWKKFQLHLCVICIFIALLAIVIVGWHFHHRTNKIEKIGKRIFFDPATNEIYLSNPGDTHRLNGEIGINVPTWQLPFHCHTEAEKATYTCLRWKQGAILRISYFERTDVNCYNISWEQLKHDLIPFDCFDIGADHWYGPGNQSSPYWPLKSESFVFSASMSRHFDAGTFSSAIDYHWISSGGSAIFVPNNVPLEVNWNKRKGKICLISKYSGDFYGGHTLDNARLNYTVCSGKDAVATYKYTRTLMGKITTILQKLKDEDLKCSVFEIAGQWQTRFGDLDFNNMTVNSISNISDLATSRDCTLSVEINPYFDVLSSNFKEGIKKEYFIKDSGKHAPGIVNYRHEINAMLDVSETEASEWMKYKLGQLKERYNIQSFSVIYGEPYWIPYNPSFHASNLNPSTLREMYSEMFSSVVSTSDSDIIQGTSNSQDIPHLIPVPAIITNRNGKLCLTGAIERTLALGIKGYPFVVSDLFPDDSDKRRKLPSKDLYIKWIQLSAFFPAVRYSIMPWEYDQSVVEIAKNMTKLHKLYITGTVLSLKGEIKAGLPIIRPIWWVFPDDEEAFKVSDEFLVGDNILVAPVLCEDVNQMKIYFPEGMWSDKSNGNLIQGKSWITYEVNKNEIPFFLG